MPLRHSSLRPQHIASLSHALLPQFFELGGCIFVRHVASERLFRASRSGRAHDGSWDPDRTGSEAFENHLHPLDLFAPGLHVRMSDPRFRAAEQLGQAIAHSWFSRLVQAFPGQRFRVYYARGDNPTVRLHRVYRSEGPWLADGSFPKEMARGQVLILTTPGRAA